MWLLKLYGIGNELLFDILTVFHRRHPPAHLLDGDYLKDLEYWPQSKVELTF